MKDALICTVLLTLAAMVSYGLIWLGTSAGYAVFYEDMVTETISQKVNKQCLKETNEKLHNR